METSFNARTATEDEAQPKTAEITRVKVAPLPTDPEILEAMDGVQKNKPLKDYVKIHVKALLANSPEWSALIEAAYSEDAVEGSLDADDWAAAMFLRTYAKEQKDHHVASFPLSKVRAAMKRALGDLRLTRWQRRDDAAEES